MSIIKKLGLIILFLAIGAIYCSKISTNQMYFVAAQNGIMNYEYELAKSIKTAVWNSAIGSYVLGSMLGIATIYFMK